MEKRAIICISRTYASGGHEIGRKLAETLGIPFYDKELLVKTAQEQGIDEKLLESFDEQPATLLSANFPLGLDNPYSAETLDTLYYLMNDRIYHLLEKTIREIAAAGSSVIIGRAADEILKDDPDLLSVFIFGNLEEQVERLMASDKLDYKTATKLIQKNDKKRANYHNYYSDRRWGESCSYDLSLSASRFGIDGSVKLIIEALEQRTNHS
jgi:CMP/dCMP kinase